MDLQTMLSNATVAARTERLKTSPQITLGELIARLKPIAANQEEVKKKYGHEADVCFDFEYAYPTGLSSWRGSYAELALNFSFVGYGVDGYMKVEGFKPDEPKVSEFLAMLKKAVGQTYTGWKGGDFVMGKTTPIWVANDGNAGETAVVGVENNEHTVRLITARCEY